MSENTTNITYNPGRVFNDGETLHDVDLNRLIAGINGSVTNIALGDDNVTLTITKNDGSSVDITLPSGGGSANLSDYVRFDSVPTNIQAGPVKIHAGGSKGISVDGQFIMINPASEKIINAKSDGTYPLTSKWIDLIVKVGLTSNLLEWSIEEKTAAQELLGITDIVGTISTMLNSILDLQEATE